MISRPIWWDYVVYYPDEDEEGFDGIHYGGLKCLRDDASEEYKKDFKEFKALVDQGKLR